MGIVDDLLIMRRMALLTTIHRGQFFMLFLFMLFRSRLLVAFQTLDFPVHGRRMIIHHFFMAFRAFGIGLTITGIDLCRRHRWISD